MYTRCRLPKRVKSVRGLSPWNCSRQHSSFQRNIAAAVGHTLSHLTGPRFEPQTSRSRDERATVRPTGSYKLIVINFIFWRVVNWTFLFVRNCVFNIFTGLFENNAPLMILTTRGRVLTFTVRQDWPECCPRWNFFWSTSGLNFFPTGFTWQLCSNWPKLH